MKIYGLPCIFWAVFLLAACGGLGRQSVTKPLADSIYQLAPARSADGIGKRYLGREIAQTMSHFGAEWLDRAERMQEERTDLLLDLLAAQVKPAHAIADIGAGSGYISFRLATLVPQGHVYAVDIQPEMLAIIQAKKERNRLENVQTVLGAVANPNLPENSLDWVLLVDAYHEFSHPYEMMQHIRKALKPTGQVVLLEYRGEDESVPIKPLHKMTEAQARREMAAVGFAWLRTDAALPWQHVMYFGKAQD